VASDCISAFCENGRCLLKVRAATCMHTMQYVCMAGVSNSLADTRVACHAALLCVCCVSVRM
jgi:hypothetical protein